MLLIFFLIKANGRMVKKISPIKPQMLKQSTLMYAGSGTTKRLIYKKSASSTITSASALNEAQPGPSSSDVINVAGPSNVQKQVHSHQPVQCTINTSTTFRTPLPPSTPASSTVNIIAPPPPKTPALSRKMSPARPTSTTVVPGGQMECPAVFEFKHEDNDEYESEVSDDEDIPTQQLPRVMMTCKFLSNGRAGSYNWLQDEKHYVYKRSGSYKKIGRLYFECTVAKCDAKVSYNTNRVGYVEQFRNVNGLI
jgi:hypothetical protein